MQRIPGVTCRILGWEAAVPDLSVSMSRLVGLAIITTVALVLFLFGYRFAAWMTLSVSSLLWLINPPRPWPVAVRISLLSGVMFFIVEALIYRKT